jgi:class 3 adenylate cyclase
MLPNILHKSLISYFGGEILVTNTVRDTVTGANIHFEDHGFYELKGVPGEWRLYAAQANCD